MSKFSNLFIQHLLTFFLIVASVKASATRQTPDKVIYHGKEYSLEINPLEDYFFRNPGRPKGGIISTGLWRGYIATFEIRDSQLFLKDIQIQVIDSLDKDGNNVYKLKSVLNEVFPNRKEIKIDWLNRVLVLQYGEFIKFDWQLNPVQENCILLEIEKGDLKKTKNLKFAEFDEFVEIQFSLLKKTADYEKAKTKVMNFYNVVWMNEQNVDRAIREYFFEYIPKILED